MANALMSQKEQVTYMGVEVGAETLRISIK